MKELSTKYFEVCIILLIKSIACVDILYHGKKFINLKKKKEKKKLQDGV